MTKDCLISRANSVRLNQVVAPFFETNSASRFFGRGKQSSSRQTPCGLITNLVARVRSEEHTSELQSQSNLVCRLLLEKKNKYNVYTDISDMLVFTSGYYPRPLSTDTPSPPLFPTVPSLQTTGQVTGDYVSSHVQHYAY